MYLRKRANGKYANYELYITDNHADDYLDEFIWNVVVDKKDNDVQLKSLIDNPYTYEQLKNLKFKYAIIWLENDKPVYGFFITTHSQLPTNVARCYVRQYKIDKKNNPLKFSFVAEEHKMYAKHLAPILKSHGIDTMFFTRHVDAVNNEQKFIMGRHRAKRWYGYDLYTELDMLIKGIRQNVHYFNAWQPEKKIDKSFLNFLENLRS